ncbi:MAG: SusD/RagB family nutrient-binding outer membrane lipoprotein [Tannerella sp.]|nr:SusD/RagB family nutrient-binding outer membrane lipoprotein [Tannerella sp.]
MKKLIYNISSCLIATCLMFSSACTEGFEELNTDPKNPTQTNEPYMFTGLLDFMNPFNGNFSYDYGFGYLYYLSQVGTITSDGAPTGSFTQMSVARATDTSWDSFKNFMANANYLENMILSSATSEGQKKNQLAILRILRAKLVFDITDLFGDMPYSEAGRAFGTSPIYRPKYDTQESIYKSLLADLDEAIDNLSPNDGAYGNNDILFKSNTERWKSFANTIRLKHALRMSNVDPAAAKTIIGKVLNSSATLPAPAKGYDLANFDLDAFTAGVNFGRGEMDGVNGEPGLMVYYNNTLRIGTALWNQLSDAPTSVDGSDFFDPRAVIFMDKADLGTRYIPLTQGFGQRSATENFELDWSDRGVRAYHNNREENGDAGYYGLMNPGVTSSPLNYNIVKGNVTSHPQIWYSAAEVQFMLAEIYAREDLGFQDLTKAKEHYVTGLITSVKFWYDLAYTQQAPSGHQSPWVDLPTKPNTADIERFLSNPKVDWDKNPNKLGLIYTQRWIEYVLRPHDAFFLRLEKGDAALPYLIPEAFEGLPAYFRNFKRLPMQSTEISDNFDNWQAARGEDDPTVATWWQKK